MNTAGSGGGTRRKGTDVQQLGRGGRKDAVGGLDGGAGGVGWVVIGGGLHGIGKWQGSRWPLSHPKGW